MTRPQAFSLTVRIQKPNFDLLSDLRHADDPRTKLDSMDRQPVCKRGDKGACSPCDPHGRRHLPHPAQSPWQLTTHAVEEHVALFVLGKSFKSKLTHQFANCGLDVRPEPRRA